MEEQNDNFNKISSNVFLEKPHVMSRGLYVLKTIGEFVWKFIYRIFDFVFSMFLSIWHFIKLIGVGAYKGVIGIYNFFKRKCHQFRYNDVYGRVSFGVFGVSSLKHKQYFNGVLYLVFEVAYLVLFCVFGISSIAKLTDLDVGNAGITYPDDCEFCDPVYGSNSIMVLIYGLLWVISIFIFLYIWNRNINAGYANYRIDKFMEYDKLSLDQLEAGSELDTKAEEAFYKKVRLGEFNKENASFIKERVSAISDKESSLYTNYLLSNVGNYTYAYLRKLRIYEKKHAKLQQRLENILKLYDFRIEKITEFVERKKVGHEEDYEYIDKLNVRVESAKNDRNSRNAKFNKKIKDSEHKIYELKKTHTNFVMMQNVKNNKKYGKFNDYYNVVANYSNQIDFFSHYDEFVSIYEKGFVSFEEANKNNADEIVRLEKECADKIVSIEEKYKVIREKRAAQEEHMKEIKLEYDAEVKRCKNIKDVNERTLALNEAKNKLIEESTLNKRKLKDLPSKKNVDALEKEEIKECKEALKRDKKYLKTNYNGQTYGKECVINKMIVDYKYEFKLAKEFVDKYFVVKNNELVKISENEIQEKVNTLTNEKVTFENAHPNKYLGRNKSFKESFNGLLNENFHITILTLPVVGILLFTIVPLCFSILVAFTNYSVGHIPPTQSFTWVGWENFQNLLFPAADSIYTALPSALLQTVGWTFIWAILATFTNYILGIIVALLINKDGIKLKKLWRTVFVLTIAIPQFISLLCVGTLLKDTGALGNWYFQTFGSRLGFGTDSSAHGVLMSKVIIVLVNIWVGIPYTILSTTGILLNIPKDLYESAKVDGAGTVTQFLKITMPYILFVTGPYLITQFIGNINNFNVIYFLTGGGPALAGSALLGLGQTDLLITFLYKIITSTNNPQYGIASSVGIIIFIICSFISIVMYNKSGAIKEEDQFQ